jgi:two-component system, cell cycle response regulator DivK
MMARILIVEDNALNLKLATVILRTDGHEIVGAADADAAERHLAQEIPDLILMDMGLPGKDGYTLTKELRRWPSLARVPIVALTSFAMKGDRERAMAAGCSEYLTKPINRAVLLGCIRSLLPPVGGTLKGSAA